MCHIEGEIRRPGGSRARYDRAFHAFRDRFGRGPRFAAAAPGRVNLIGEHTDYNGGFVLPIAIDRETVIAADLAEGDHSTLVALDLGRETRIDLTAEFSPLARDQPHAFANYLVGVVQEFKERGCAIPNLDLIVASTIPIGAGLSSSASVEVATATLLEQAIGESLDPIEKARLCQRAEHRFAGTPCGVMDMLISILAREGHALLIDCRSEEAQAIQLPPADEMTLLVCDTGVKHALASGEYAERRAACEHAARKLGLDSLRDATMSMIEDPESGLDEIERKRASHVVLENVRTLLAATALHKGDLGEFCNQMFESHRSLRDLYEVSCAELDVIVDAAYELRVKTGDDRLGARMTGAGFGGCAIIFCRTAAVEHVMNIMQSKFKLAFDRDPIIFTTRAARGARTIEFNG